MILLGLLVLITGELSGQNWNKISKDIKKQQLSMRPPEDESINRYYTLIRKSNVLNEMESSLPTDTVFILQISRVVNWSSLDLMAWNRIDTLHVCSEDFGKTFQINHQQAFTSYMMKLVSEWNLDEIRKEELNNGMIPSYGIFATRIIINGERYQIDCFYFRDFFNIQRDVRGFTINFGKLPLSSLCLSKTGTD